MCRFSNGDMITPLPSPRPVQPVIKLGQECPVPKWQLLTLTPAGPEVRQVAPGLASGITAVPERVGYEASQLRHRPGLRTWAITGPQLGPRFVRYFTYFYTGSSAHLWPGTEFPLTAHPGRPHKWQGQWLLMAGEVTTLAQHVPPSPCRSRRGAASA